MNSTNEQYIRMTTAPIGKLLLSLSIPTIITMMVTNIYNIVDTAFIGTLGTSQSGAVGVVFSFMCILQAVAFMCGQGAGSLMSRKLGAKNKKEATMYTSTGFFLSFFMGLAIAILSFIFMEPLLDILGSTKTIAPYARSYMIYILIAAPFNTASLTMNNLLRYEGKAKLGTVGLMVGAVLNISGDAFCIFELNMGIAGAGLSTAVSQIISFCILLYMFLKGKTETQIRIKEVVLSSFVLKEIIGTGFPSLLRQGLNSIATMLLNNQAKVYGDAAVSAMSIATRISFIAVAVALGIGQGFQPISSFNYGAKKYDRVKEAFKKTLISAEVVITITLIPIFIYAPTLVRMMRDDTDVIVIAVRALRLMCIGLVVTPFTMVVEMGFQSTGAKLYATMASSLRSGFILIPVLLILSKTRGLKGIQEAQPLAFVITAIMCLAFARVFINRLNTKMKLAG